MALKVGVVGLGFMGRMHSSVYKLLKGVELAGVADTDRKKAEGIAKELKTSACGSLRELLAGGVDIVDVCLPTHLHAGAVVEAFRARKHVLCEKPMAANMNDAMRMTEAWKKAGTRFMIAHCIRFWPEYVVLKEMTQKKKLGSLKGITMARLSLTPVWSWKNWLLTSRSGGALVDLHIHDTDFLLYLLGKPRWVFSTGRKMYGGFAHIRTTYGYDGVSAHAEGGWDMPAGFGFEMSFRAEFEKGTLLYNCTRKPTLAVCEGKSKAKEVKFPVPKAGSVAGGGNISDLGGYYNEIKYFVDCILRGKKPSIVTPEGAMQSLSIALAEIKSAETGKVVYIQRRRK